MKKSDKLFKQKLRQDLEHPEINDNVLHMIQSFATHNIESNVKEKRFSTRFKYALLLIAVFLIVINFNTNTAEIELYENTALISTELAMLNELYDDLDTNIQSDDEIEEMLEISSAIDLLLTNDEE